MKRFLTFLALLFVFPVAIAHADKARSGPVGVYFVQIPWIAEHLPSQPEARQPLSWVFHSDGTFTQGDQDPDTDLAGYWRRTGRRTIVIQFLNTALDWHEGFPPFQSVNIGEGRLEFSRDFSKFNGEIKTSTWICPHVPGAEPPWLNLLCPNPITTDIEPDYQTLPGEEALVYGWRLPAPTFDDDGSDD